MRKLLLVALLVILAPGLFADDEDLIDTSLKDSGLEFRAGDAFSFNLHTSVQFRLTYHDTRAEGTDGDNGRDFANFSVPGVRTFMHGHFFAPEFQYRLWLVWSWPGQIRLEDAFFRWAPLSVFNVTVGQQRVPASWEYLVDHERQGFTGRSITDEAFKQGWGKGVTISGALGLYDAADYNEGTLTWQVGVFNGALASPDGAQGRGALGADGVNVTDADKTERFQGGFRNDDWRTDAESFSQLVDAEMMLAGRVEFHPLGVVRRHMTGLGESTDFDVWKMMIAVGANWMTARVSGEGTFLGNSYFAADQSRVQPPTASGRQRVQTSIFHATVDGHFRWISLAVNWAFHYRSVEFRSTGRLSELDLEDDPRLPKGVQDFGATVDVSYFVLEDELSIQTRFSIVDFDEFQSRMAATGTPVDGDSFGADSWEYGGGLTWYIHGDNLKLSADYRYVVQQLPHGAGPLADGERISDYRVFQEFRLQLQWIF